MAFKHIGLLLLAVFLAACSTAETVRAVDSRPVLQVRGAPSEARIYVDGLDMGEANTALRLEPGTHVVQIRQGLNPIYQDKVFLSGAVVRTINLER